MKTTILTLAAGVSMLAAAVSFSSSAFADRVCTKHCDDGVCRTRCVERDRDRDHVVIEHRERHHDHDEHDVDIHAPGVGVEIGH
jgi:hypothetical protein